MSATPIKAQSPSAPSKSDRVTPLGANLNLPGRRRSRFGEVRLLAPVTPSKIVAIGLNYADHAAEGNRELPKEPMLFIKPSTAVIGPGDEIIYPPQTANLHYEGELAIVIGKPAKNVAIGERASYVLGYTCANDVTARDLQRRDVQFTRGKGFDTFAPLGPWIITGAEFDPSDLAIQTRLNGAVRQNSRTSKLIFNCDYLISYHLLGDDAAARRRNLDWHAGGRRSDAARGYRRSRNRAYRMPSQHDRGAPLRRPPRGQASAQGRCRPLYRREVPAISSPANR